MIRFFSSIIAALLLAVSLSGTAKTDDGASICATLSGCTTLRPILDLDFTISFDSRITFTRASEGTCFNSAGTLVTFASGDPRLPCYTEISGADNLGFTIEDGLVWHALHNRDFTNVVWVKSTMTAAKDATGLDEVANSASTLTATGANATALQTVTISSAAFTYSIYVKRVTGTGDIDITDNNGTNWTTLTGLSTTLWTRHDITRTQANPVFGVRIVTDTDAVEVDFVGLEPGAFPTSAVATTDSTVTRAADVPTMATSDIPGFLQSQGTVLVEFSTYIFSSGSFRHPVSIDDGGTNERYRVEINNSGGSVSFAVINGGSVEANFTNIGQISADTAAKVIARWAVDDFAAVMDGGTVFTDTSGNLPTVTTIAFGIRRAGTPTYLNGSLTRVTIWNRLLSDGRLQDKTAFLDWWRGTMFAANDNDSFMEAVGW